LALSTIGVITVGFAWLERRIQAVHTIVNSNQTALQLALATATDKITALTSTLVAERRAASAATATVIDAVEKNGINGHHAS
jgi:hypothetical protein